MDAKLADAILTYLVDNDGAEVVSYGRSVPFQSWQMESWLARRGLQRSHGVLAGLVRKARVFAATSIHAPALLPSKFIPNDCIPSVGYNPDEAAPAIVRATYGEDLADMSTEMWFLTRGLDHVEPALGGGVLGNINPNRAGTRI